MADQRAAACGVAQVLTGHPKSGVGKAQTTRTWAAGRWYRVSRHPTCVRAALGQKPPRQPRLTCGRTSTTLPRTGHRRCTARCQGGRGTAWCSRTSRCLRLLVRRGGARGRGRGCSLPLRVLGASPDTQRCGLHAGRQARHRSQQRGDSIAVHRGHAQAAGRGGKGGGCAARGAGVQRQGGREGGQLRRFEWPAAQEGQGQGGWEEAGACAQAWRRCVRALYKLGALTVCSAFRAAALHKRAVGRQVRPSHVHAPAQPGVDQPQRTWCGVHVGLRACTRLTSVHTPCVRFCAR